MFSGIQKDNLHHAYLLVGEHEVVRPLLSDFLREVVDTPLEAHPDVSWLEYDFLSADDARDFRVLQSQAGISGGRRFFIISTHAIYPPAQNMLLKTFEEPFLGHHFFMIVPNDRILLPTLLSRFQIIRASQGDLGKKQKDEALAFLKASPVDRMEIIKPFAKKLDDPEEKRALKREAVAFVHNLQEVLHEMIPANPRAVTALKEISQFEPYFSDSSVNMKMILEHLAGVI